MTRHTRLVLALSAALAVPACADPGAAAVEARVASLDARMKQLESERDRLSGRLDAAERRLGGLQEDLMQARKDALASADAAHAAAAPAGAGNPAGGEAPESPGAGTTRADVPAAARALSEVLGTEAGREVFDQAMRTYEERRDRERTDRLAGGMVESFARKANLSAAQTESMRKSVGKAFTEIGALWRSMRDADLTPEERSTRRTDALAKTEEIRQRVDDEMKAILDSTQYETFQQESARMRGFLGGTPGGPGGFGGGRDIGR